jgi:hypothetical protein
VLCEEILVPKGPKKSPDKDDILLEKADLALGGCVLSSVDVLVNDPYPCSGFPANGVDGVRFKRRDEGRRRVYCLGKTSFMIEEGMLGP